MLRRSSDDNRLLHNLTDALRRGDTDAVNSAFEAIYNAYAGSVALVCARYLSQDPDIQSVTDDVFLRFFNRAPYLDEVESLRAYLSRAARHAALDHLREQAGRERGLVDLYAHADRDADRDADPLTLIPDGDGDVTAHARYQALVEELCATVGKESTAVILAHAVCGESFPAIAARLGKKENTVKTLYHRALKKYRNEKGDRRL